MWMAELRDKALKAMIWLPNSPDPNLIEHLRVVLKQAWCDIHVKVRTPRMISSRSWSILFTSLVGVAKVVTDWCMFPKQSFPFNALAHPALCCFGSLPARVDKDGCFFHLAEEGLVAQPLGLWRQGAGNYYEVTLRHKCVQGNCPTGRRGGGIKPEERKHAQTSIIRFSILLSCLDLFSLC